MRKLYIDDIRNPKTTGWDIVRSYDEFVAWINLNGLPDMISFDHDLSDIHYSTPTEIITPDQNIIIDFEDYLNRGNKKENREYTGYDCALWICDYCLINNLKIPRWNVHSANPIGRDRIDGVMNSYAKKLNV